MVSPLDFISFSANFLTEAPVDRFNEDDLGREEEKTMKTHYKIQIACVYTQHTC